MSELECVTYQTEEDGQIGALKNWENFVKEQVPLGIEAKKSDGTIIDSLAGLTDSEIAELKLCGKLEGKLVTDNGTTIAYTRVFKAHELDLWFYIKPPDKYMIGVVNYIVMPYDPAWGPPDD